MGKTIRKDVAAEEMPGAKDKPKDSNFSFVLHMYTMYIIYILPVAIDKNPPYSANC
jgi:hypothetical protein